MTYDPVADAAMLYLVHPLGDGAVASTEIAGVDIEGGAFILDFDAKGKLLGIEILGASKIIASSVLAECERRQK